MDIASYRSDVHSHKTPEPIDIKFDVGDYVGVVTRQAKIQNDCPIGGFWAYGRSITLA